jgi:N-methylhydantoinase B
MRTAFSPNIKERADCSTAIFDAQGQVVALAQRVPIHLGSMVGAVYEMLKRYPLNDILPGDQFVANDPYNGGGTHLPDINIIAPVFIGRKIVAFVANIAHHADVGGMVPGSEAAVCKSIYQEGLRFRRCASCAKENESRRGRHHLAQFAHARRAQGDLNAQFAATTSALKRAAVVRALRRAETAATIAATSIHGKTFSRGDQPTARGPYEAEDFLDGNTEDVRCRIRLAMTVGRGRIDFDFAGSDKQLERAQHSISRAARDRLHGRQEPARSGSAGQRRLLPHAQISQRRGNCSVDCGAAGGNRLPLDFRERAGRCDRQCAVAGDAA